MKRRHLLQAASMLALPSLSFGQDKFPGKPITIICPYPAGGNIGTEAIVRAKPDGHTIGMGNFAPLSVNPTMFKKVNFDPLKDLAPICLIERGPLVLMVRPDSPFRASRTSSRRPRPNPAT